MGLVVNALVNLSTNLPPTLSTTQVASVRKKLKSEMTNLIKHPATQDFLEKITPRLLDLGSTPQEIARVLPKVDESRKYNKRALPQEGENDPKRIKLEDKSSEEDNYTKQQRAITMNENYLIEKLTLPTASEIVLKGLLELPQKMPNNFKVDYNEALKKGKPGEVKTVARLMAELFVENGVGPGSSIIGKGVLLRKQEDIKKKRPREDDDEQEPQVCKHNFHIFFIL